jgi:hypothetical protein
VNFKYIAIQDNMGIIVLYGWFFNLPLRLCYDYGARFWTCPTICKGERTMNKGVFMGAGGTVGGAAGAVLLTALSFAVVPIPALAAVGFGVGVVGGTVGGAVCSGKIYDKIARVSGSEINNGMGLIEQNHGKEDFEALSEGE